MVIDLSHTIKEEMTVYPGTEKPKLFEACSVEKDKFKETEITMFSHTGTHADAPAHVFSKGKSLDSFPVEQFCGKALVVDCRDVKGEKALLPDCLEAHGELWKEADFLLFCFGGDKLWGKEEYFKNYPYLGDELLELLIKGNYKGIGVDLISIDPVGSIKGHKKLLGQKDMIIVENLCNLDKCPKGLFDFACLPLKFENSDGAPLRAVALV